jgi:hypothetical protein
MELCSIALGQVSIVLHSHHASFNFPSLNLNLECELCDHMIMRFTSVSANRYQQDSKVLICERDSCILCFLNELNLTYQRLTGYITSFDFIPIVLVPWDKFSLCCTSITPILAFQDQISIFITGCVTI